MAPRPRTWSSASSSKNCTKPRRAILDDPDFGEPCVYSGIAGTVQRLAGGNVTREDYWLEGAGLAFERRYYGHGRSQGGAADDSSDAEDSEDEEETYGDKDGASKDKSIGSFFKISDTLKGVKLYELFGITESATQDEIKKAYRSLVLTAHPDKIVAANEKEAKKNEERFVQIQEAYDLLSIPARRQQYDSTLDFDDKMPKFKADGDSDFFEVFGECFKRNARWSTRRPVPELGNAATEEKHWKKFYDFWYEFQSWRDPLVLAEKAGEDLEDLEQADSRDEKRWMMKENARVARKYKQAERDRVADLVRLAEKFDPRIQAEKDAKKLARQEEAAKRELEKTAVLRAKEEVERKRQEVEDAAALVEAKKRAEEKAAREEVKQQVKKLRQRVRVQHDKVNKLVSIEQVNEVCLQLAEADLKKLGDDLEAALKKGKDKVQAVFFLAIKSIGLMPIEPKDESVTTGSGPSSEDEVPAKVEVPLNPQEKAARDKRKKEEEKLRQEQEAADAEERARLDVIKAEEKKKRDEQRKIEQQKEEAKKRQMEKKEKDKEKKNADKEAKKVADAEAMKQQQREEALERAALDKEKATQVAEVLKAERELERVVKAYENDRTDRLQKLQGVSDEELSQELQVALDSDATLRKAIVRLREDTDSELREDSEVDRAAALVYQVGAVWPLALLPPTDVTIHSALRSQVKKARGRLRGVVSGMLSKAPADAGKAKLSEWQRGIVDLELEYPEWNLEDWRVEHMAAKAVAEVVAEPVAEEEEPSAPSKKGKKGKEAKAPEEDEDLDSLLAEFGVTPEMLKKKGKNKKK